MAVSYNGNHSSQTRKCSVNIGCRSTKIVITYRPWPGFVTQKRLLVKLLLTQFYEDFNVLTWSQKNRKMFCDARPNSILTA